MAGPTGPTGPSGSAAKKDVVIYAVEGAVSLAVADGVAYFTVGEVLNGKNLTECHVRFVTAGTTNVSTIQIARYRSGWVDMLSTAITVDSGELGSETAATGYVIDTSNDDVAEYDLIRIDVDTLSTTKPKGLIVRLTFE